MILLSKAFINKAIGQTDTIRTEQTDSIKSIAKVDSCITDTVALVEQDTMKLNPDSLVWNPKWAPLCVSDIVFVDGVWDSGYVMGDFYPGIQLVDEFPLIPEIFDTAEKNTIVKASDKKEIFVSQNDNPIPAKEPVKKESVISAAVLPEELKRKSESGS